MTLNYIEYLPKGVYENRFISGEEDSTEVKWYK